MTVLEAVKSVKFTGMDFLDSDTVVVVAVGAIITWAGLQYSQLVE